MTQITTETEPSARRAPSRAITNTFRIASGVFELFVLAEILYYYLSDAEQTLHGAIIEAGKQFLDRRRARLHYWREVENTRSIINNLPETR